MAEPHDTNAAAPQRGLRFVLTLLVSLVAAAGLAGFVSLGVWQVHRLGWKEDLIQRVDARVHADPIPAPGPADWPAISAEASEYTRVELTGTFLNDEEVQIYVPSDLGPSYWVMTPLARDDGTIVMVNRGMVPERLKAPATRQAPEGEVTVTGLLRMPEDKGWLFSRANDPENQLWYRRDIASITATKGFDNAAPYFVDEERGAPEAWPRGGQTVIQFRNAHLQYALTWFALAALVLFAWGMFIRSEVRR
ncbi:SURF1 family protein [Pseudooceanicola nanhaiensis]|uniref:SURF1 family protein n=1 Tax=Pseudooceanicola nanhaiensis TaxID=375761 RepID=UPI001CD6A2BC|nr:SURF1 family protein [Pseudooceanicola nanhaiensis]MCA0919403.1 SURF1 family protein [Pseudooceanicola nanhaiensis]